MKKTVLLIDDDALCRGPAAEMLRRDGWLVVEAGDGEEGIELAKRHRPQAVICDLLMPRANGFQVCRAIRSDPELRGTHLIVVSGRDYATDRTNAIQEGANDFLVKPFDSARLRQVLAGIVPNQQVHVSHPEPSRAPDGQTGAVTLKFWGVRGSIPSPGPNTVHYGGNTSCVELRADGEHIILDAGTGIRPLGESLGAEFGEKPMNLTLLITHTHWDHIQGFPFFLPAYSARNRLRILGYEGARASLAATLAGQMESPYFPIALKQMPGNIVIEELREMQFSVGSVRIEACFSNHPGVCVGFRLFTSGGSIVYLPDNEWSQNESATAAGVVPCTLEKNLVEFIRGADVLIVDSQYDRDEYKRHVGWGHGCSDDVVHLAMQAGVKQLFLFHHDPAHSDTDVAKMLKEAQELARNAGSSLEVSAAREGESITLG